jgi:hypothetical protein
MNKEFVTYEQALALKELGFDERCFTRYYESGKLADSLSYLHHNYFGQVNAPLYQQAFRWFRDKHNLVFNFISYSIVKPGEYHWSITWNDEAKASGIVKTYEEAEQACLDKLIEICKNKQD